MYWESLLDSILTRAMIVVLVTNLQIFYWTTFDRHKHSPLTINKEEVERVPSFKFLGTHITEDLTWSDNTTALVKIKHKTYKKKKKSLTVALLSKKKTVSAEGLLRAFYQNWIESILMSCLTARATCTEAETGKASRLSLPILEDIFRTQCMSRAKGQGQYYYRFNIPWGN